MSGAPNKWCFVPGCRNTSLNAPDKKFLSVPITNYSRKVKWFKAARRDFPKSKSTFYCCEDHFNLEEDMKNYMRYKLMGGKMSLKEDVVPHIFDCQPDRKGTASAPELTLLLKRQRKQLVEVALMQDTNSSTPEDLSPVIDCHQSRSTGQVRSHEHVMEQVYQQNIDQILENDCENWMAFINKYQNRIIIKKNLVPHRNIKGVCDVLLSVSQIPVDGKREKPLKLNIEPAEMPAKKQKFDVQPGPSGLHKISTNIDQTLTSGLVLSPAMTLTERYKSSDTEHGLTTPHNKYSEKSSNDKKMQVNIKENCRSIGTNMSAVKYCFVPMCPNTSANSRKYFLTVPKNRDIRRNWCAAVGREPILKAGTYNCCEDHFDLENDCENWLAFINKYQNRIIIKKNLVPHRNIKGVCDVLLSVSQIPVDGKREKPLKLNIEPAKMPAKKQKLDVQPGPSCLHKISTNIDHTLTSGLVLSPAMTVTERYKSSDTEHGLTTPHNKYSEKSSNNKKVQEIQQILEDAPSSSRQHVSDEIPSTSRHVLREHDYCSPAPKFNVSDQFIEAPTSPVQTTSPITRLHNEIRTVQQKISHMNSKIMKMKLLIRQQLKKSHSASYINTVMEQYFV